jgi:hypothetical protein
MVDDGDVAPSLCTPDVGSVNVPSYGPGTGGQGLRGVLVLPPPASYRILCPTPTNYRYFTNKEWHSPDTFQWPETGGEKKGQTIRPPFLTSETSVFRHVIMPSDHCWRT